MATFQGRIMARSPFYIIGVGTPAILSATLKVYIYTSSSAATPATPTYTIQKDALTSTSFNITFEISALIRDYFIHHENSYNVAPSNYADALWVETELDIIQSVAPQPATINNLYVAFDGYGNFNEGANSTTFYNSSYSITPIIRIETGTIARMPFYVSTEANDGIFKLETFLNGALKQTIDYSVLGAGLFPYDRIAYFESIFTIDTIRLHYSSTKSFDISVEYIDECKYSPKIVGFINKEGLLQLLTMFKLSKEQLNITRDSYKKNLGFIGSSQFMYDTGQHQTKTFNVDGQKSITLNSDFINESENNVYEQMLMSEFIVIDNVPVNIKASNFDYKTSVNDKLINYTIEFDYANELINNV